MSNTEPKQVIQTYLDALVSGDIEGVRNSFAEDATWTIHGRLPIAGTKRGRSAIIDDFLVNVMGSLFVPGSHQFTFTTMLAEGDVVALEWRVVAKTASGDPYDNEYVGMFVVRDGLIQEVREYCDTLYVADTLYAGNV